ncbi:hypothetical protein ACXWRS_11300, partial [Streptococcus pyogenes]
FSLRPPPASPFSPSLLLSCFPFSFAPLPFFFSLSSPFSSPPLFSPFPPFSPFSFSLFFLFFFFSSSFSFSFSFSSLSSLFPF